MQGHLACICMHAGNCPAEQADHAARLTACMLQGGLSQVLWPWPSHIGTPLASAPFACQPGWQESATSVGVEQGSAHTEGGGALPGNTRTSSCRLHTMKFGQKGWNVTG